MPTIVIKSVTEVWGARGLRWFPAMDDLRRRVGEARWETIEDVPVEVKPRKGGGYYQNLGEFPKKAVTASSNGRPTPGDATP